MTPFFLHLFHLCSLSIFFPLSLLPPPLTLLKTCPYRRRPKRTRRCCLTPMKKRKSHQKIGSQAGPLPQACWSLQAWLHLCLYASRCQSFLIIHCSWRYSRLLPRKVGTYVRVYILNWSLLTLELRRLQVATDRNSGTKETKIENPCCHSGHRLHRRAFRIHCHFLQQGLVTQAPLYIASIPMMTASNIFFLLIHHFTAEHTASSAFWCFRCYGSKSPLESPSLTHRRLCLAA